MNSTTGFYEAPLTRKKEMRLRDTMKQLFTKKSQIKGINRQVNNNVSDVATLPKSEDPVEDTGATQNYDNNVALRQVPWQIIVEEVDKAAIREETYESPLADPGVLQYLNSAMLQQMPDRFSIGTVLNDVTDCKSFPPTQKKPQWTCKFFCLMQQPENPDPTTLLRRFEK